jgi:FlaA1/EpsC-like NDP-sugar epimerase
MPGFQKNIRKLTKISIIPRWMIFCIDLALINIAFFLAVLIRYDFKTLPIEAPALINPWVLINAFGLFLFLLFRTYAGIIRFSGVQDALRIFFVTFFLNAGLALLNFFVIAYNGQPILGYSIIVIHGLLSFVLLTAYRLLVKYVFVYLSTITGNAKRVVIYGAGDVGISTKRALEHDLNEKITIVAFVDDDLRKANKRIDGVRIEYADKLPDLLQSQDIDELIIATLRLPADKKNHIVDICLSNKVSVFTIPPLKKWINGQFQARQLQNVKIEDLLDRDPIMIYNDIVGEQIKGKNILITGGAGSIGSEIVRQCLQYKPKQILIVDTAESALHDLELELLDKQFKAFKPVLASVCNLQRMESIFQQYQPAVIYHAAAYKHVPMMEHHPVEAILTNVKGSKMIADLAVKYGAERMVMVSTDKAVNPTNVMGASKRIAEIYVQSYFRHLQAGGTQTKFITTRFGNVLGSNGSVIPRFKKQIEAGGPVTVTHPEITRYFMTIPEACQLVLEAGAMGEGGEVFVFDMGKSVKIVDLAKKMIQLSGFVPDKDIKIEFTGLRPGEKLYEELLTKNENTIPTYHEKILIAKTRVYDFQEIQAQISQLIQLAEAHAGFEIIVQEMKILVPEFISKNSAFEQLDKDRNSLKAV